jgi:rfaE bifunctional protein kinase chain/domain
MTGDDSNGRLLKQALTTAGVDCSHILSDARLQTTTKVRVLAGQQYAPRQQVIRIDYANRDAVSEDLLARHQQNFADACEGAAAIIISDYNYGAAYPAIAELAREFSQTKGIPLLIDSRFRLSDFPGATAATPNKEEVEQILGNDLSNERCDELRENLGYEALLVTCGSKGMTLFRKDAEPLEYEAVGSKEPIDVTGAGDTVIGTFALGLASGLSFPDAATIANHAGGIVVMKRGTASVNADELIASLGSQPEDLSRATRPV